MCAPACMWRHLTYKNETGISMLLWLFITLLLVHSQVLGEASSSEEDVSKEHVDGHPKSSFHSNHWGYNDGLARGEILAIAFGLLFVLTLLLFFLYAYQQQQKHSKPNPDSRQNVIYKPTSKDDV